MVEILGRLWRMSLQSSVLILFVLAVRPFMKRYPKAYSYGLWILVGVSLLCPFSVRSPFSLQPALPDAADFLGSRQGVGAQPLERPGDPHAPTDMSVTDNGAAPLPESSAGQDGSAHPADNAPEGTASSAGRTKPEGRDILLRILCALYLAGTGAFLVYCLVQYLRVYRRIAPAVRENGNFWLCETVQSPFVIGIMKPRILLPYGLSEPEKTHILLHERTHIRHHDPFARLVSLACVCLHWWNPACMDCHPSHGTGYGNVLRREQSAARGLQRAESLRKYPSLLCEPPEPAGSRPGIRGIQYRKADGEMVFYMHDLDTGSSEELYRCSDYFLEDYCVLDDGILLLLGNSGSLTLLHVGEDKTVKDYGNFGGQTGHLFSGRTSYCSIGNTLYRLDEKKNAWSLFEISLPERIQPYSVSTLMEEGDDLYFMISGEVPDSEWSNTFLLRYNTKNGESTLLREFYLP